MKPGIRAKLILTLFLASVLPLTLGLISLEFFGYRTYRNNQGAAYQMAAANLAHELSLTANAQIEKLSDWTRLSSQAQNVRPLRFTQKRIETPESIEKEWTSAEPSHVVLRGVLENELSRELRAFQKLNPTFGEIFVTDARGLVVAATNKTSDYQQADELWWQRASQMKPGQAWLEGIAFDPSAQLFSLDASLPIRDSDGKLRGVVKGVLNASQLLSNTRNLLPGSELHHEVVLGDGRVLVRFFEKEYAPLSQRIAPEFIAHIRALEPSSAQGEGWTIAKLQSTIPRRDLVGYAPLQMQGTGADRVLVRGLAPMYVLVYEDVAKVLAPVRWQLWQLGFGGAVLLLGFALLGLYVADRKIIVPLRVLSRAARSLSQTASLGDTSPSPAAQKHARRVVQQCRDINTRDEIEELADDFAVMGERVLEYHQELEKEIANKTGEIQRDLEMAREFQEALLPREYPTVPENSESGALRLHFHHVYEPALSVGGDFFDVFKLSEHQAGIFIADVMGHGARSALVTAILRTLLQDLSSERNDPAELMRLVNQHFFDIVQSSRQFVFVSAFCLVIDAQESVATYASAGHPSPLVAESASGRVLPLLGHAQINAVARVSGIGIQHSDAALGVARDSSYHRYSRRVTPGDAFLLYTDGIVEAPDAQGEEFGMARLSAVVSQSLPAFAATRDVTLLTDAVMNAVNNWMHGVASPDDICLVAVSADNMLAARKPYPNDSHFNT